MHARLVAATALMLSALSNARAQLPMITVPNGSLRIELSGAFYPSNDIWNNGSKQPLGSVISGAANNYLIPIQSDLASALGHSVSGLSLGTVTAIAAREHGVGDIGLAYGWSRKVTFFATVPIVYVRSRAVVTLDPTGSRVGVNPGHPVVGTIDGQTQTSAFFSQFNAALSDLSTRISGGSFKNDSAALALAQQTLSSGTRLRDGLYHLLADPTSASPIVPTATDPLGTEILTTVSSLQTTLAGSLGVTSFSAVPVLPQQTMQPADFTTLLESPGGFSQKNPTYNTPRYAIGDLEGGVAVQLLSDGAPGSARWRAAWVKLTARFTTGAPGNSDVLLDQDVGNRHPAGRLEAIYDVGRRSIGLRTELAYQHQLPASEARRLASPLDAFVSPAFLAAVHVQPGDSFSLTARPFIQFAPHLAVTGTLQYWRRSMSNSDYVAGQVAIDGTSPAVLDVGSAANALVIGFGLTYSNPGGGTRDAGGLPVEAGWSIERTVYSGAGVFPVALTSRVSLRVYRPLVKK